MAFAYYKIARPATGQFRATSLITSTTVELDLITPREAACALHTTEASLAQQRYRGIGAPFVRLGRRVFYRRVDLETYIAANVHECVVR